MSTIMFRVVEVTPLLRMQYSTANKYGHQYEQCMNRLGTSDLRLGHRENLKGKDRVYNNFI